jgi:transcriptional antiterminator NusG
VSTLTRPLTQRWYAVAVVNGRETRIREEILKALDRSGLRHEVAEILLCEEDIVVDVGTPKQRTVRKPTLPGYLLVRTARRYISEQALAKIAGTRDVMEFMGGNDEPTALPAEQVQRLLGKGAAKPGRARFSQGDTVKIINGPMSDFPGTVTSVNDSQQKARVEVEIFGRATPVELSFDDLRLDA